MSTPSYLALPYLPSSVRIVPSATAPGKYDVIDTDGSFYATDCTKDEAERWARTRRGVVKAAITRRANKARVWRNRRREELCEVNGVTWAWLRFELSEAEADAWLGLD